MKKPIISGLNPEKWQACNSNPLANITRRLIYNWTASKILRYIAVIKKNNLGRYIVGYTVKCFVLRRRVSGAVKLCFRTYIQRIFLLQLPPKYLLFGIAFLFERWILFKRLAQSVPVSKLFGHPSYNPMCNFKYW